LISEASERTQKYSRNIHRYMFGRVVLVQRLPRGTGWFQNGIALLIVTAMSPGTTTAAYEHGRRIAHSNRAASELVELNGVLYAVAVVISGSLAQRVCRRHYGRAFASSSHRDDPGAHHL